MLAIVKIALVFITFFTVPEITLTKAKDDFAKINKVFLAEKLSVEMEYKLFEQYNDYTPVETRSGIYFKSGKSDYSKIMDIETLHTPELTVIAMNEEKLITVSGPISEKIGLSVGPDTLLRFCKQITITDLANNIRKYEIKFDENANTEFKKIELTFDTISFKLNKFIIYYPEQNKILENGATQLIHPKVEISYKNYNKAKIMPDFSEGKYITKVSSNKYKSTGKYSSYKIYNQKIK